MLSSVYGRFDLVYDGTHEPKMLEYNADTPTGLIEAAVGQWCIGCKTLSPGYKQFNCIHERLIEAWSAVKKPHSRCHVLRRSCRNGRRAT
jgi:glutathionylspermidine synthase